MTTTQPQCTDLAHTVADFVTRMRQHYETVSTHQAAQIVARHIALAAQDSHHYRGDPRRRFVAALVFEIGECRSAAEAWRSRLIPTTISAADIAREIRVAARLDRAADELTDVLQAFDIALGHHPHGSLLTPRTAPAPRRSRTPKTKSSRTAK